MLLFADVLGMDTESFLFLVAVVVVVVLLVLRLMIPMVQGYREGRGR